MAEKWSDQEENSFKNVFKQYKRRQPPPDFTNVIDFRIGMFERKQNEDVVNVSQSMSVGVKPELKHRAKDLGLIDPREWMLFGLRDHPGFTLISNPFEVGGQHQWVRRCLEEYPQYPNKCNIDNDAHQSDKTSQRIEFAVPVNLRWVTLGYHYDWNTKMYYPERYSPIPPEMAELTSLILDAIGYPGFTAEASIINYYNMNSTLSGHTDHSEFDLTSPLISISFGQSAVFLLGGQTKAIKPTAMFVRSGDIVILAGKSRLSYHGVPKILSIPKDGNAIDCLSKESLDFAIAKDFYPNSKIFRNWMEIYSYMQESRINISVRQVFAKSNT